MKIEPTDALIVVDVQMDFCQGGALAVDSGDEIVPGINAIVPRFANRIFTRDWHPADHCSFSETPQFVDKSWPSHCVANMPGAQFHHKLKVPQDAVIVNKGRDAQREAYSGFDGTDLANTMRARNVSRVFVCGLATDYCVKATALDAAGEGFATFVLEDLCRGVNVPPGSAQAALDALRAARVRVVDSGELV